MPCTGVRHHAPVTVLRPHTRRYSEDARTRLGIAVTRAREALGHQFRPSFVEVVHGVGLTSLVKLETGKPVGPAVYEAVARALPNWTEDTPVTILEGGPVPELAARPQPTESQRRIASIVAELEYFRELLGPEDFDRMMALANAMYHERRRRESSKSDNAESDQLEDTG